MKLYFINSGCSSENLDFKRLLAIANAEQSSSPFEADVIIAHLCAISTDAFKEIPKYMSILKEIKKNFPETKIYVGGCASEIVDLKKRYHFVNGIFRRHHMIEDLAEQFGYNPESKSYIPENFCGAVRIQSGCMRNCGFCKKAYMNMEVKSSTIECVIADIKDAITDGYSDIMLLAENSTEYGIDFSSGERLIDLLKGVIQIQGLKALRISGLCIDELVMPKNRELLEFIRDCDRIYQVQLEIQSLIPEVRKAMNLTSSVEDVLSLLNELKNKCIITNIMVGYPEETEEGFNKQLELIKTNNLYYVQVNRYDDTPMVYGHSLKQINSETVSKRLTRFASVIREMREKKAKELIERTKNEAVNCLLTSEGRWIILGEMAHVNMKKKENCHGDIVKVKITEIESVFNMHDPYQSLYLKGVRV